jgi:hypothetical protein
MSLLNNSKPISVFGTSGYKLSPFRTKSIAKAAPLQPWTVPEGSRSLRLPDFKTFCT